MSNSAPQWLIDELVGNSKSKLASDKRENWVTASHRVAKRNHAKGAYEIQTLGEVHCGLRIFERAFIPLEDAPQNKEVRDVDYFSSFFIGVAREWILGVFSAAYKLERGDVFQRRNMKDF